MITSLFPLSFGASIRGGRPYNEDSLGKREPRDSRIRDERGCLYVLADGMGGHRAGEVASRLAVETVLDAYYRSEQPPEKALSFAIKTANALILESAASRKEWGGMGCTIVASVIHDRLGLIAHVGDSRAYHFRQGTLQRLTRDHLYVTEILGMDEKSAQAYGKRHILSRALGTKGELRIDTLKLVIEEDDRLLLCTDGLTNVVGDDEIPFFLSRTSPKAAARGLLALARLRRTRDNASSMALFLQKEGAR